MANHLSLQLLLLAALITAANLHLLSAADTPPPPSTAPTPTPPSNPPPPPSTQRHRHSHHRRRKTPPIPPPPTSQSPSPPPEIQENPLNPLPNIIDGLIGSSDFLGWNQGITTTDVPIAATFFVPDNNAILHPGGVDISPFLILYHIVPQRLTFSDLQKLPVKTRLPTLLPNKFILITNNSPWNFTVDGSPIVLPDVFSNAAFVLHGIGKVLDFSVYGGDGILLPPPENTTSPPGNTNFPSRRPLKENNPDYPREMTSSGYKHYPCSGILNLMGLLTLGYARWYLKLYFFIG